MGRLNNICKAAEYYGSDPTQYLPCEICEPCLPRTCCKYVSTSASGNDLIVSFDNTIPSDLLSCIDSVSPAVMTKLEVYFDGCPDGVETPDYVFGPSPALGSSVTIIGGNLEECICLVFYENSTEVMRCAFSPSTCVSKTYNTTAGNITESAVLTDGVTVLGTNTLTLTGANTYTCHTIMAETSTLSVGALNNLGSDVADSHIYFIGGGIKITGASLSNFGSHTVYFVANFTVPICVDTLSIYAFGISAVMNQGTGGLTKTGVGRLELQAANTYTGTTLVSEGTLLLYHNNAVQHSTVNLNTGELTFAIGITAPMLGGLEGSTGVLLQTVDTSPVALSVGNNNASTTYSGVLSGTGSLIKVGGGILTSSGANTFSGTVTVSAGTLVLSGVNTFPSGLTKLGAGTLELSGANTFTGAVTITAGTLALSGGAALADTVAITVEASGILNVLASETVGSVAGDYGSSIVISASQTLTAGNASNQTFSGVISGSGAFTKVGSGILTLGGGNSFTGALTISVGTVSVTGTVTGDTTVSSGGTLSGSNGTLGNVTVESSGTLSPGGSGTGSLTVNGDLELKASSNFNVQFDTDGGFVDAISVSGDLNVTTGAVLSVSDIGSNPSLFYDYQNDIITYSGTWNGGTFAGLPDGTYFTSGGRNYLISYNDNDISGLGLHAVTLTLVASLP